MGKRGAVKRSRTDNKEKALSREADEKLGESQLQDEKMSQAKKGRKSTGDPQKVYQNLLLLVSLDFIVAPHLFYQTPGAGVFESGIDRKGRQEVRLMPLILSNDDINISYICPW